MQTVRPTLLGRATFAWQSDYSQFYLVDGDDAMFQAPIAVTAAMEERSLFVPDAGLVVYTQGCLQQHIRIEVYDNEPVHPDGEPMTGMAWTRVRTVNLRFPSLRFRLSSPSWPEPLPSGPMFFVGCETMSAHIAWKEYQGSRDDTVPIDPDVIGITMWAKPDGDRD